MDLQRDDDGVTLRRRAGWCGARWCCWPYWGERANGGCFMTGGAPHMGDLRFTHEKTNAGMR